MGCTASGGTSISFIKQDHVAARPDLNSNEECSWVEIHRKSRKNILFGTVYLPPDRHQFTESLSRLKVTVKKALEEGKHLIMCGDWNSRSYEFGDSEETPNGNDLIAFANEFEMFFKVPGSPTRPQSGSILDFVLTTSPWLVTDPVTVKMNVHPSENAPDHIPISFVIKLKEINEYEKPRSLGTLKQPIGKDIVLN